MQALMPLVVVLVLGADPGAGAGDSEAAVSAEYQARRSGVGQSAAANVALSLWCEQHGLLPERSRHLAIAALAEPDNRVVRGLQGLVLADGRYRKPGDLVSELAEDAARQSALDQYEARRAATPLTAEAQWKLALWCEELGLGDQARAHLIAVVRMEPRREAAWKRLGYSRRSNGQWMTDAQHQAMKAEAAAQEAASKIWGKRLATIRKDLRNPERQAEAREALAAIDDPRAVPSILEAFATSDPVTAVQLLGQIDDPRASRPLAFLAVFAADDHARRVAGETLRQRDPREFADLWVGLIQKPIRYEVKAVGGPGQPGVLYVEGEEFDYRRFYNVPAPGLRVDFARPGEQLVQGPDGRLFYMLPGIAFSRPDTALQAMGQQLRANPSNAVEILRQAARSRVGEPQPYVAWSTPTTWGLGLIDPLQGWAPTSSFRPATNMFTNNNWELARRAALSVQAQLEQDVAAIEQVNSYNAQLVSQVLPVLQAVTGVEYGVEPDQWRAWLSDQLGYRVSNRYQTAKKVVTEVVQIVPPYRTSCFGAGTPVHTQRGLRPIEELQVGDLVLSQDPTTGTMQYEPVVVVHHNPPSETLRVEFEDDAIVASRMHRFWKVGQGWVMARDLKAGDPVRVLGGIRHVAATSEQPLQPVFNLDVAGNRTFLVGRAGCLVHDNSVPGLKVTPFDRPAGELAAAAAP